jgi:hypothetical protein
MYPNGGHDVYSLVCIVYPFYIICSYWYQGLGRFLISLVPHTVGKIPWMMDKAVAKPLRAQDNTLNTNRTQTSIVHVSDRMATVIDTPVKMAYQVLPNVPILSLPRLISRSRHSPLSNIYTI